MAVTDEDIERALGTSGGYLGPECTWCVYPSVRVDDTYDIYQADNTRQGILHKAGGPWTFMQVRGQRHTYVDYDTFEAAATHYLMAREA